MIVVLDAEAVNALIQPRHRAARHLRHVLTAAHRLGHSVAVSAVTLSELYRGAGRSQGVDALLSREGDALLIRDTDREFAKLVGGVLAGADAGSAHIADAHVVAAAVEAGGAVIVTSDPDDLSRLAAPYRSIAIERLD